MELSASVIQQYLNACENQKRLNSKTIKAYSIDLRQFMEYLDDKDAEFDREAVKDYLSRLNQDFKPRTVKRKRASLRALVTWLMDEKLMERNPFENLHLKMPEPEILPRDIPLREIERLLAVAHAQMNRQQDNLAALRDTSVMELLFATGIRVSELSNLKTKDVDLIDGVIRIFGKGSKERIVQVANEEVLTLLRKYEDAFQPKQDGTFFQNRNGNRLSDQSVRGIVRKYTKTAGILTRITPHMFRHSLATMLVDEDVSIRIIQKILGHSSILTTQIYANVSGRKQRDVLREKHPRNKLSFPLPA